MKSNRPFPSITVSEKCVRFIKNGHMWVYGEEIAEINGNVADGCIADVLSKKGTYLGSGFFNSKSKIAVRILSANANDRFDADFFRRRVKYAIELRLAVLGGDIDCCRLIFGESDGFPGLTVDKFGSVLVAQTLSLGIEIRKKEIFSAIIEELKDRGISIEAIYERNDVVIREKEGLSQGAGFFALNGLKTDLDGEMIIAENGVKYKIDFKNGQKTGFFLDQRFNRLAVARLAQGRRALDCFTHSGAFALNCALAGAEHVTAVDISSSTVELVKENSRLNGVENIVEAKQANVFELLSELCEAKRKPFDLIILDPPAFTKSNSTVANAFNGYKDINMRAMRLLPRGGFLATCSCSHFMSDELFRKMLKSAAHDAGVSLLQLEARQQGMDHPILWGVPETEYLKFYIFRIV